MEELVAELGAAFLCSELGLPTDPRKDHAPYIASWLQVLKNDKCAIFTAAAKAQEAIDWMAQKTDLVINAQPPEKGGARHRSEDQAARRAELQQSPMQSLRRSACQRAEVFTPKETVCVKEFEKVNVTGGENKASRRNRLVFFPLLGLGNLVVIRHTCCD